MQRLLWLAIVLLVFCSCANKRNTATNRFLHSFNTRYNVYFNASENYAKALKTMNEGYTDDFTQLIPMFPVSLIYKDKESLLLTEQKDMEKASGVIKNQTTAAQGSWDYSIEKCQKAIKLHSITEKPKRKSGQRNNPAYQKMMIQNEYNPFLSNAWLLMGKARFHKGQFLTAASTFSYIARTYHYDAKIATEAAIWAARSYEELGWFFEAEDLLLKLNNDKLPSELQPWFASVQADYLIKQERYSEAVPFLITAAKHADTKRQKARMTFLLGQLHEALGDRNNAYRAFVQVPKFNPHYELEFNARIKQTEVYPENNPKIILNTLNKMAKSSKNESYLDQIFYAIGNIYLSQQDTAKAVENYVTGVEKSTRNGMEKAILQIKLGDVYFASQQYVEAQPCFSEAVSIIQKNYKDYDRVVKLSETLDELVVYVKEVQLQDSLQYLATLSENEQLAVVKKIIEEIEKKELEEKENAERAQRLEENQSLQPGTALGSRGQQGMMQGGDQSFYFYNPTALANGKTEFQRKWGRRKQEDNWRRKDKSSSFGDVTLANSDIEAETPDLDASSTSNQTETTETDSKKDVNFYLAQIPKTPEQIETSNAIIADGYYNMGLIYKNKLDDYSLAINEFNRLENRYPQNDFRLNVYYNMFLMYLKMKDKDMTDIYRYKLIEQFPKSDYAIAVKDPNFEHSIILMNRLQDSLYQATYAAYLDKNTSLVRSNYELAKNNYPLSKLMPKFMLIDALTYAASGDAAEFKTLLTEITQKHADSEVIPLVNEMLKGLAKGRQLAIGGQMRGMLWDMLLVANDSVAFAETDSAGNVFSDDPEAPFIVAFAFPADELHANELLFSIASFNFSTILTRNFDLELASFNNIMMILVKNFLNFDDVAQYLLLISSDNTLASSLQRCQPVVISEPNYTKLTEGRSIAQYMTFYDKAFGKRLPIVLNETLNREMNLAKETPETPLPDMAAEPEIIAPFDLPETKPEAPDKPEEDKTDIVTVDEINKAVEDVYDKFETTKDDIVNKAKQKWNELLYGKPELTEEEKAEDERIKAIINADKEAEKQAKKEARAKEKADKKAKQAEEIARLKAERDAKREAERQETARLQAERDSINAIAKAKQDAIKAKEHARKEKAKEREQLKKEKEAQRKEKEKERREAMRQKEKERKERQKK
jgi:tetratricopeptide (TPR) repeat protein